jgi:hypothetical protein
MTERRDRLFGEEREQYNRRIITYMSMLEAEGEQLEQRSSTPVLKPPINPKRSRKTKKGTQKSRELTGREEADLKAKRAEMQARQAAKDQAILGEREQQQQRQQGSDAEDRFLAFEENEDNNVQQFQQEDDKESSPEPSAAQSELEPEPLDIPSSTALQELPTGRPKRKQTMSGYYRLLNEGHSQARRPRR